MELRVIDRETYGSIMRLPAGLSPEALSWAAADHLRWEVWRRGLCPQGTATRAVRVRLRTAGYPQEAVEPATTQALQDLLRLGDLAKLPAADGLRLAPVQPKLLELSPSRLALVGSLPTRLLPEGVREEGLCRHLSPEQPELVAAAQRLGAGRWPLESWVGVTRFMTPPFAAHEGGRAQTPSEAWQAVERWARADSLEVSDLDSVQVVDLSPGGTFGKAFSEGRGRWGPPTVPGTWPGRRLGYTKTDHTHHILVSVTPDGVVHSREIDKEHFNWTVVARGAALGLQEVVEVKADGADPARLTFHCTFPPPRQVWRALTICGRSSRPWRWSVPEEVQDRAEAVLGSLGLTITHST